MDQPRLNVEANNWPKPQKSQLLDSYKTNSSWVKNGDLDGGGDEDS